MIIQKVAGFDWDSGNIAKCKKHGLEIEEIEFLFSSDDLYIAPDMKHSSLEDRFLAIGISKSKRPMIVAFTTREKNKVKLLRPISARYMHQKELRRYEKAFAKIKE